MRRIGERISRRGDLIAAEVRRQQQILLVRQLPVMLAWNMIVAIIVATFLATLVPPWQVLTWLAVMLATSMFSLSGLRQLAGRPLPETVTGRMLKRAEYWGGLMGLLWASLLLMFHTEEVNRYLPLLAVIMVGLTTSSVSMLPSVPRPNIWFSALVLAPLVFRFVVVGDPIHVTLAVLILIFFLASMNSLQRAYRQLLAVVESSVELQWLRTDLVDAIESIRDAFAIWHPDGTLELANERFKSWFGDCGSLADVPGTKGLHKMSGGVWLQGYLRPMRGGGSVTVHTDVTALKNRERDLIAAKLHAEEASHAKTAFLANMSHELRTPLNAIMGFAEMMRKGVFGPLGSEKYRQYVEDIHGSAGHLLTIIEDILNLSRVQSAGYELSLEPVEVGDLVDWVLETCARQDINCKSRSIDVQIEPACSEIRADSPVLRQVLLHLVRNAVKFTPESGRVSIEAKLDDLGQPRISVIDTGVGIAREKLWNIRQPFEQAEGAFSRKFRGAGVGLSIADALVRRHGGQLELDSEVGKGTRASIILPAELCVTDQTAARAS